jgi:hypothetical protein
MGILKIKRQFRREVRCFVCGGLFAEGEPTVAVMGVYSHRRCCDRIDALSRVYDRSALGRWRPVRELLEILNSEREERIRQSLEIENAG